MYFISIALLMETDEAFVASLDPRPDLSGLSWGSFFTTTCSP